MSTCWHVRHAGALLLLLIKQSKRFCWACWKHPADFIQTTAHFNPFQPISWVPALNMSAPDMTDVWKIKEMLAGICMKSLICWQHVFFLSIQSVFISTCSHFHPPVVSETFQLLKLQSCQSESRSFTSGRSITPQELYGHLQPGADL